MIKKEQLLFWLLLFSIVFIIWFSTLSYFTFKDYEKYLEGAEALLNGQNPYSMEISENYYPPLHFIIYSLLILIFGKSMFAFKLGVFIIYWIDIILIFLLFQTIIEQNKQNIQLNENPQKRSLFEAKQNCIILPYFDRNKIPYYASVIYAFYPLVISRTLEGLNDGFPNFFFILGLICFVKDKHEWAAICFSGALLIKLTTLFIYPWIFIYFYKKKEIKTIIKYGLYSGGLIILFVLPFVLNNFGDTFNGLLKLFQKPTYEARFDQIFFKGASYNSSFLYSTIIPIFFGYTISLWALIQISLYLLLLVVIPQLFKTYRPIIFFKGCAIIYCALPLLTLGVGTRYYYWAVPLLLIMFFYDKDFFVLIYPSIVALICKIVLNIINPIEIYSQIFWFIFLLGLSFYQIFYIFADKRAIRSDSFRY